MTPVVNKNGYHCFYEKKSNYVNIADLEIFTESNKSHLQIVNYVNLNRNNCKLQYYVFILNYGLMFYVVLWLERTHI